MVGGKGVSIGDVVSKRSYTSSEDGRRGKAFWKALRSSPIRSCSYGTIRQSFENAFIHDSRACLYDLQHLPTTALFLA